MGWVDEQIRNRINIDKDNFEDSMLNLSSVILGKKAIAVNVKNQRQKTQNAIGEILKYYKIKVKEIPEEIKDYENQIDYAFRPTGIMRRPVELEGKWWTNAVGPMLGRTTDGDPVALLPSGVMSYSFFDYQTGKKIKINNKTVKMLNPEAICFYKPFPMKKINIKDLIIFTLETLSRADFIMIISSTLATTLLGMISPILTKLSFDQLIPSGKTNLILPVALIYLGVTISSTLVGITSSLITGRVRTKMTMYVESATMSRVISLPASFFKNYSTGDLASRVSGIQELCIQLTDTLFQTGLSSIFSFAYIFQMITYGPAMVIPSLIIIGANAAFAIISTFLKLKISRKRMNSSTELSGVLFSLFNGVQKIKLAGCERRAFAKWAENYKKIASIDYDPPIIAKFTPIAAQLLGFVGSLVIYYFAGISKISISDYLAFGVAYGSVQGAVQQLVYMSTMFTEIKPLMEMIEPLLKASPEVSDNKKIITNISGSIELQHVSFSYTKNASLILNNINLKIKPGQYIAIVGKTGCGKSTLMRLLLGFETPNLGSIYFDGVDIKKIDLKSLRHNIGVVMQNGKLFSGDVYSNIVISAPHLNMDEAWEAARLAGIEEDIKDMPMGMNTLISEGQGGISGGQRQRLMIARAIAPKPKVLMLDEATSALDNITQKQVSDSLESLKSTRIVIAHRLSTIKHCDRIIMLEKGKIIEDGNYEELISKKGKFAELVERQRVDDPSLK